MKTLIIYYSYEGNTKMISEKMAQSIGADLMSIKPVKEMKSKGFMKYVWGGKAAVMQQKPKLEEFSYNMEDYDLLIFGSPVWAGTFAPVFNTLFDDFTLKDKKVAYFYCNAGGPGKVATKFQDNLQNNELLGGISLLNPLAEKNIDSVTNKRPS